MSRIAVVCAYPAGENPGMLSVDLAFGSLAKGLPAGTQVSYFCAEDAFELKAGNNSLKYTLLERREQLLAHDRIVYWGDFLHWIGYFENDFKARVSRRQPVMDPQALRNAWYDLFLMEGASEAELSKVVVFGGTLYGLHAGQLAEPRYRQALSRLYRHAGLVLMRDQVSADYVAQLAERSSHPFGCDCAMLLDGRSLQSDATQSVPPVPYLVCSFGRSGAARAQLGLVAEIAQRRGLKVVNIDWLGQPRGLAALANKLALIRGAQLVVTDVYHMAVSSWREGVPVLGIGRGASQVHGTLSDKKKEIFFRQIFASRFYVFIEDVLAAYASNAAMSSFLDRVLQPLDNPQELAFVREVLQRQQDRARGSLLKALA